MDLIIGWSFCALLVFLSIIFLSGRGCFLIAGYNSASKEEKSKYNKKRLCRVVGGGSGVIAVIVGIMTFYHFELPTAIRWLMPWGYFGVVAITLLLTSTICKVKQQNQI